MQRLIQSLKSTGASTSGGSLLPVDATQSPLRLLDLVMHAVGMHAIITFSIIIICAALLSVSV
jgi:hypothetical protein